MSDPSKPDKPQPPIELDVHAATELLRGEDPPLLLDVREPAERQVCSLGEGLHIPIGEIPLTWQSLPRDRHLLVYCHHGMRSLRVAGFLRENGLHQVQSIRGGTDAWSLEIDPTVARY
jgi:rhodanese-related sulfurtransferase